MSAREHIAELLRQWREVTHSEFAAIKAGDWDRLHILQAAKDSIQQNLSAAREKWSAENPIAALPYLADRPLQAEVGNLVALENRKLQLLEARREKLRERQTLLKQAHGNVRRLRDSYAGSARAKWDFYS